jgi:hypothetical protein
MLPDITVERLAPLLVSTDIHLAYYVHPWPRGVLSTAQGGLALLFPTTTTPSIRYEQAQRLRFQLIGLLPPGHSETIALNDSRLPVAAAVIEHGTLIYSADEAERLRYEMMVLSQILDFQVAARRFLHDNSSQPGRWPA